MSPSGSVGFSVLPAGHAALKFHSLSFTLMFGLACDTQQSVRGFQSGAKHPGRLRAVDKLTVNTSNRDEEILLNYQKMIILLAGRQVIMNKGRENLPDQI